MTAAEDKSDPFLTPRSVTWLGLVADALLGSAKIVAGVVFASQAILADGFHSGSDLITDVAVLAGLGMSQRPADGSHPYGHRRISTLVAMFVGAGLLIVAGSIAYGAVLSLRTPHPQTKSLVPLALALTTVPVKELLYRLTRRVGVRTGDLSLTANAWHHRSDAFTSVAAATGLSVIAIGGPAWAFVDEATAMVLTGFLGVAAVKILRDSGAELIDRATAAATVAAIKQAVEQTDGVRDYHAVRARQVGGKVSMDIHVLVDPELTVREGHDIASAVEASVRGADPSVLEAIVHVEPCERDCPDRPAARQPTRESQAEGA